MKVNFCKFGFYLENMGGMVNCKNFYKILYLINTNSNTTIIMYLKGVMAIRLGEKKRILSDKFVTEGKKTTITNILGEKKA